jgi:hypothetical protein
MNTQVKNTWIKALRSGNYQQAQGALRVNNTFCCLGVLCDLHAKATGKRWRNRDGGYSYSGASAVLPEVVIRWAGLTDDDPFLGRVQGNPIRAAGLNDKGKDFNYIAKRIERYL